MLSTIAAVFTVGRDTEDGQALVEYALILALVSVVAIAALALIGTNVTAVLNTIASDI